MPQNQERRKMNIHFGHNKEINKKAIKIHIGRVFSVHAKIQNPEKNQHSQQQWGTTAWGEYATRRDDDNEREKQLMNMDQFEFQSASVIAIAYECREVTYFGQNRFLGLLSFSRSLLIRNIKKPLIIASRVRLKSIFNFRIKSYQIRPTSPMTKRQWRRRRWKKCNQFLKDSIGIESATKIKRFKRSIINCIEWTACIQMIFTLLWDQKRNQNATSKYKNMRIEKIMRERERERDREKERKKCEQRQQCLVWFVRVLNGLYILSHCWIFLFSCLTYILICFVVEHRLKWISFSRWIRSSFTAPAISNSMVIRWDLQHR